MKKFLSKIDYIFIIIAVISVLVLSAGVFSIDYVLNRPPETVDEDDLPSPFISNYQDEINLLDELDDFKKYYISVQDINFSASIEDVTIDVFEDSLNIDGVEVISGVYPTKFLSFYGDSLIIPFVYNDSWFGGILIYNLNDGDTEVIDKIDNKYIVNDMESFTSSRDGIMLNISIVNGNRIIIDNHEEDICNVKKSKKTKVMQNIFLKYNSKKKKLITDDYEVISSINLESYYTSNDLC